MSGNYSYKSSGSKAFSLASGFLENVEKYPKNNALWINNCYYSYEQLYQIVIGIYKKIPTSKIYKNIGIYCNDDVYTYAAILATCLYGAAYVPLNNRFPVIRNKKIIELCDLELIIHSGENEDLEKLSEIHFIKIDSTIDLNHKDLSLEKEIQKPLQPNAYILFTSGTTGEPKGVAVSNSNVFHCFDFFLKNFDFNSNDRFLQVYELTFDVSVFSFFMPLQVGACCYVVPSTGIRYLQIIQLLSLHKITVLSMVPGILNYIEQYMHELTFDHLRYSFFSGDALHHHLAVKWQKTMINGKIHNFYGPTETTIVCTHYPWEPSESEKESINGIVPLGKPFKGMHTLIIDASHNPSEKGELCLAGEQVIESYLNNSNSDSFFSYDGRCYYKTGDITSVNSNGNLLFHGRTDGQVKINGYRVELKEIEFIIEDFIKKRTVVVCVNENHVNKIVAFIETDLIHEQQTKLLLSPLLADYMLPHRFVAVKKFPLNTNQKIDMQALLKFLKQNFRS